MKKLLVTLSAVALVVSMNAQEKKTEYWENGNKKSEGVLIGSTVNANASKVDQARQNPGQKDGKWSTWFENGTQHSEEYYMNGVATGEWKAWYDDGKMESTIDFGTGKAVFYHKNGNKASEGTMSNGMTYTGKWTGYYETGEKNYEGSYTAAGKKDGTWTWYDKSGKVTGTQVFVNGELK